MGDNLKVVFRGEVARNHSEVFIKTLKGKRLFNLIKPQVIKSLKVKLKKKNHFYKVVALTFSFLPVILTGNLILGNSLPKNYIDKEIAFKHVATPVTVFFDGQKIDFITEKAIPEEALKEKGIFLNDSDITLPSRNSILDGQKTTIVVKRARPIIILDNGKEIRAMSAYDTVQEILENLGIKIYPGDKVVLENPIGKLNIRPKIVIDRLNTVTLSFDNQLINLKTHVDKVKDLLAEQKISLAPQDLIDPGLETFLTRSMLIKVIRVNENTIIRQVDIPYEIEFIYDNNLSTSEQFIVQGGIVGRKEQVVNLIHQNGWLVEERVLHEKILALPQKMIIKKGTKQVYSGLATWYGPGFEGGHTASGEPFSPCALTAAHRTLPFGTQVRVTNLATGFSCIVRINDRGPYSYHIIDLTRAAANAIGMGSVAPVVLEVL